MRNWQLYIKKIHIHIHYCDLPAHQWIGWDYGLFHHEMFAFAATVIYAVLALCALPPAMFVRSCLATKVLRKNKYAGYCKQNESRQFISLDRGYICSPTFAFLSRGISKTYRWNNHNHNTAKAALYNHKDDVSIHTWMHFVHCVLDSDWCLRNSDIFSALLY